MRTDVAPPTKPLGISSTTNVGTTSRSEEGSHSILPVGSLGLLWPRIRIRSGAEIRPLQPRAHFIMNPAGGTRLMMMGLSLSEKSRIQEFQTF